MVRIAGAFLLGQPIPKSVNQRRPYLVDQESGDAFCPPGSLRSVERTGRQAARPGHAPLWRVFLNREAASAIYQYQAER